MSDEDPVAYDGFGAPIYAYQLEDDMPTDLPEGFKGTGKPVEPEPVKVTLEDDDKAPGWFFWFMAVVTIAGLYTVGRAVFHVVQMLFGLTF